MITPTAPEGDITAIAYVASRNCPGAGLGSSLTPASAVKAASDNEAEASSPEVQIFEALGKGVIRMNYQKIILAGNATDDAKRNTSKKGDVQYTTFDVGVGDIKDQTTFFPVVVFGETGEAVAKYVTKGRLVLVEGRVQVNDRGRLSVVADIVRFGPESAEKKKAE